MYIWQESENREVIFQNNFRWHAEMIPWNDRLLLIDFQSLKIIRQKMF